MKICYPSEYKHKIGEYVVYKNNGICRITDIRHERFPKIGDRVYYILNPVYDSAAVIYAPVDSDDTEKGIRRILTADEIDLIIDRAEEIDWILPQDSKERAEFFEQKLLNGDRAEYLWMIKKLHFEKREREDQKKKLYATEAKMLLTVEKIITEEFAFALGINKNEVIPYIIERVNLK